MAYGERRFSIYRVVKAHHLQMRQGLIGLARTADMLLASSGIGVATASGNAALSQGYVGAIMAGNDASISNSGGILMAARGRIEMHGGSGGMLIADTAHIDNATIPLAITRNLTLSGNARVVLTTPQAAALGIGCGAALAAVWYLLQRQHQ